MSFAVPVYQIPTLEVAGTADRFPVRRIYTIGRNYAAHAAETGLGGGASVPGISLKPADSILTAPIFRAKPRFRTCSAMPSAST